MKPPLEVSDQVAEVFLLQLKTFPPFAKLDNSGRSSFHLSPFCLLNFQKITGSEGEQERIGVCVVCAGFSSIHIS